MFCKQCASSTTHLEASGGSGHAPHGEVLAVPGQRVVAVDGVAVPVHAHEDPLRTRSGRPTRRSHGPLLQRAQQRTARKRNIQLASSQPPPGPHPFARAGTSLVPEESPGTLEDNFQGVRLREQRERRDCSSFAARRHTLEDACMLRSDRGVPAGGGRRQAHRRGVAGVVHNFHAAKVRVPVNAAAEEGRPRDLDDHRAVEGEQRPVPVLRGAGQPQSWAGRGVESPQRMRTSLSEYRALEGARACPPALQWTHVVRAASKRPRTGHCGSALSVGSPLSRTRQTAWWKKNDSPKAPRHFKWTMRAGRSGVAS